MTTVFDDTVTLGTTTAIGSHTPDVTGTGYTILDDVSTGQLEAEATTDVIRASATGTGIALVQCDLDPSTDLTDCQIDVNVAGAPAAGHATGLFLRYQDANNYYYALALRFNITTDKRIYEVVAGSASQLATGDAGLTAGGYFEFLSSGSTLEIWSSNTGSRPASATVSTTDTSISSAGKVGMLWGDPAGSFAYGTSAAFQRITVVSNDAAGGGGTIVPQVFHHRNRI